MAGLTQAELKEITSLRQKTAEMLEQVKAMFHTSFDGLMKHDINILNQVLRDEEKITRVYNSLTGLAVESSRKKLSNKAKRIIVGLVDIVCLIERIGDCCVGLAERIEYKIKENLLFSKTAVQEYEELHNEVEKALLNAVRTMKNEDKKLAKEILGSKSALNKLVDKSRANHIERSAKGICDEWARVRYLDMLDFIKEIIYHCMEIASKLA